MVIKGASVECQLDVEPEKRNICPIRENNPRQCVNKGLKLAIVIPKHLITINISQIETRTRMGNLYFGYYVPFYDFYDSIFFILTESQTN